MPNNKPPWHPHPPEQRYLEKKYGLTLQEWWALYQEQGKRCAICGGAKRLHVDHDHRADPKKKSRRHLLWSLRGSVRGLLCWPCNRALQGFRDRAGDMRAAAHYIERPPAWELWLNEKRET